MSRTANDNPVPDDKPNGGMRRSGSGGVDGGEAERPGQSPHDARQNAKRDRDIKREER